MKLRTRMNVWFSGMIFVVVLGMSLLLIAGIYKYYSDNIERTLVQQAENARVNFNAEMATLPPEDWYDVTLHYEKLYMQFIQYSTAEFVLLNADGQVVNELGEVETQPAKGIGVERGTNGDIQVWKGRLTQNGPEVLSVSVPLLKEEALCGFARYATSLEPMKETVWRLGSMILAIAMGITLMAIGINLYIAGRIVRPIQQLEQATLKMAAGETGVRAVKSHPDEVGQLADSFNQMIVALEDQEKVKNVFIASVSHELRTPLTSILGWAVTLKHEKTNEETRALGLEIIEEECHRLAGLVDQLLDFSKLESGGMTLSLEVIDLRDLLSKIHDQMAPMLEKAGIEWVWTRPETGVWVEVDVYRMKQLMINLIDNAVKFTEPGGRVSLIVSQQGDEACVEVRDTGCGIPEEQLSKIFDKFYKGDDKQRGSGIGLSVCRALMELHGGTIEAKSVVGSGTTLRLQLPVTLS